MTANQNTSAITIVDIGAKVISKNHGVWAYSWRVAIDATPEHECFTKVSFVDADDFELASDNDISTVPSSGRLVVRGVIDIDEDLARSINNTIASVDVYSKHTGEH